MSWLLWLFVPEYSFIFWKNALKSDIEWNFLQDAQLFPSLKKADQLQYVFGYFWNLYFISAMSFVLHMHWNHLSHQENHLPTLSQSKSLPSFPGFHSVLSLPMNQPSTISKENLSGVHKQFTFFICTEAKEQFVSSFLSVGTQCWYCFSGVRDKCIWCSWQPRGR